MRRQSKTGYAGPELLRGQMRWISLMWLRDLSRLPRAVQWALLTVGGIFFGLTLEWCHVPAGLLLGPLIWGAVLGMRGAEVQVGRPAHQFGQAVAGLLIALHLDPHILAGTIELWPVVLIFVTITLLLAFLVGLVAARLTGGDTEVSVWGFMPGMAGTMIALAHERGLDSRMVAFIQILRLLMVIGAMVAFGAIVAGQALPHDAAIPDQGELSLLPTFLLIVLGLASARWLPFIPAAASLVPIVVGGALCISGIGFAVPHWLVALGFFCLGAQTGLRFTPQMLRVGLNALPMLIVAVLLLLFLCGLSGALLSALANKDLMSSILATVPGSIDSIALIAVSTGSDMSFIMALQITRLFAVVIIGPPIARALLLVMLRFVGPSSAAGKEG
jgi:membrane AbrB-like protein